MLAEPSPRREKTTTARSISGNTSESSIKRLRVDKVAVVVVCVVALVFVVEVMVWFLARSYEGLQRDQY